MRVSLETGMQRVNARGNLNRMDLEANDFHCRVSEGYEKVKEMFAERMIEIDAEADIETVFRETLVKCEELINAHE